IRYGVPEAVDDEQRLAGPRATPGVARSKDLVPVRLDELQVGAGDVDHATEHGEPGLRWHGSARAIPAARVADHLPDQRGGNAAHPPPETTATLRELVHPP